jgi:hypothetical protein
MTVLVMLVMMILFMVIFQEYKEDIYVNIFTVDCSSPTLIATLITDEDGYYSKGDLEDNYYTVSPEDYDYIFVPNSALVKISKVLYPVDDYCTENNPCSERIRIRRLRRRL